MATNRQNNASDASVIDQQSKLIAELRKFGLAADDAELGMEQSSAGLKTHNGTMYVTKDGKVHLTFDAIAFEDLTDYKNKTGQVSARRIALKFKTENGAPVKVPVDFTTSKGETIRGYYKLRTVHCGAVSLYPIAK